MRSIEPSVALRLADMTEELAGVGSWWMDVSSKEIRWSPNMFRIFGLSPGVIPSLDYAMQFVHPEDRSAADSNLEENLLGSASRSATRIVRPSGDIRYVEGRNACEFAPDGRVLAVYGTVNDVTDRVAAEQALAKSEARYRLLAENSRDVTACCRPDGTFTFLTAAIRTLLGYDVDELIGRKAYEFIHPDDRARVRKAFAKHMRRGGNASPLRYEYRAIARDGREVWLEANPSGVFDEATGALIEVQDVLRDITARKAMDRQLLAAKEAAEAANAVKTEFLSNISHELRTPLTAIIGYSDILAETPDLAPRARHFLARVESASRTLLSLVSGILDFSRLEAGQYTVSPRACSPVEIARECLDLLALSADAKGVRLEYFAADAVPPSVLIDPDAYRQILVNLIGNAVKFTDTGVVRLAVEFNSANGQLLVSVEDTGVGIPASQTGKLFRRFSQVEGATTRKHGGAGLGLAICKGLVEALGGDISVASAPGVGSVFSFRIPALPAPGLPVLAAISETPEAGLRVLIADDSAAIREVVRTVLEACGCEVAEAVDGGAALEAASIQPFDIILLDLLMPVMTGREVAAALRGRRGPNGNVPVIAFTASGEALGEGFCEHSGFDAVLAKPVVIRDLLTLVSRSTRETAQGLLA